LNSNFHFAGATAQRLQKMKTLTCTLAISVVLSLSAFGKAHFFARSELIDKAEVIAIVTIEEPEAAKSVGVSIDPFADTSRASGKNWTYAQQAKVRVEKTLKGKIPDEIVMYGKESFICAQCTLSKGRFLAFLTKDDVLWVGANWQLSLRPIQEADVEWYVSEEQRYPMKFQKMDDVVIQILAALQKQQSEQASAEQPATRSELKSDSNQTPNPETKEHSR
jgi:hypothetical protein